jgi:hypothetical protein
VLVPVDEKVCNLYPLDVVTVPPVKYGFIYEEETMPIVLGTMHLHQKPLDLPQDKMYQSQLL